jgi:hypothetical protein
MPHRGYAASSVLTSNCRMVKIVNGLYAMMRGDV